MPDTHAPAEPMAMLQEDYGEEIGLPQTPRAIAEVSGGQAPGYQELYRAAVDGRIPAHQRHNGRRFVYRRDLAEIARHFGIALAAAHEPRDAERPATPAPVTVTA